MKFTQSFRRAKTMAKFGAGAIGLAYGYNQGLKGKSFNPGDAAPGPFAGKVLGLGHRAYNQQKQMEGRWGTNAHLLKLKQETPILETNYPSATRINQ